MAEFKPTDVQKALKGAPYPTDRQHLVECARDNGADEKLVDKLAHLKDKKYTGPDQVQKEVFKS
ncbi:DUF2795 domain-containing protein [Streptomyces sp. URMC 123]|uniref:DUF2795 domain-containing protein n=1 Tax=Streptomyces sp. URMC 123 TaxID=3423403 RepID=UPI003F1C88DF